MEGCRALRFSQFFTRLADDAPTPRVSVDLLARIVKDCHAGVGELEFRYFPDFDGAQHGNFIWLEEERTSPYEGPYNNAIVFVNERFRTDRPMRRLIAAKELMHVFDDAANQTRSDNAFRTLVSEIGSIPLLEDASPAYRADRIALWKAIIALVPPWIRDPYRAKWATQDVRAHELAVRWEVPESIAAAAMGTYYDTARLRFTSEGPPRLVVSSTR